MEFLSLGLWLGSDVFLSFVVAPGAFSSFGQSGSGGRDGGVCIDAHALGWCDLRRSVFIGAIAAQFSVAELVRHAGLCVLVMMVATVVSQFTVSARMAELRLRMGSIQAAAADNPLLAEFSKLHRVSVSLESCGVAGGVRGDVFVGARVEYFLLCAIAPLFAAATFAS